MRARRSRSRRGSRARPAGRGRAPTPTATIQNTTMPAIHANVAPGVAHERDQRLRERQREDEQAAAGREQREVGALEVELVAEEDLADGRAEHVRRRQRRARRPRATSRGACAGRPEVVVAPGADEAGQLRQQGGLHRLEEQDRDAGEEEPDDEVGGDVALVPASRARGCRAAARTRAAARAASRRTGSRGSPTAPTTAPRAPAPAGRAAGAAR